MLVIFSFWICWLYSTRILRLSPEVLVLHFCATSWNSLFAAVGLKFGEHRSNCLKPVTKLGHFICNNFMIFKILKMTTKPVLPLSSIRTKLDWEEFLMVHWIQFKFRVLSQKKMWIKFSNKRGIYQRKKP